jgi:hypothetical protein
MKRSRVSEHTFGGSAFHRDRYGVLQGYWSFRVTDFLEINSRN